MIEHCRCEVVDLHHFFERWFRGQIEPTEDALGRCLAVLAPGFEMVTPDGRTVAREVLAGRLRRAHGRHREMAPAFAIRVDRVRARDVGRGLALVLYEEWQRVRGAERGRQSAALMRRCGATPHGVEWLFVQETWLPDAEGSGR